MFVTNVRKLGIRGSQKWWEPECDLVRFQALTGSGLPSRSARNSSHLVLRASSERFPPIALVTVGFGGVLVQQQNGLEEDGQVQVGW